MAWSESMVISSSSALFLILSSTLLVIISFTSSVADVIELIAALISMIILLNVKRLIMIEIFCRVPQ